jgi:hypothetical protein
MESAMLLFFGGVCVFLLVVISLSFLISKIYNKRVYNKNVDISRGY